VVGDEGIDRPDARRGNGTLFAALLGAFTITAEFRHGTIRPTLLVTPKRERVLTAKVVTSVLAGLAAGILAEGLAAALEAAGLAGRGIHFSLTSGDIARLLGGGAIAAGLFAVIGVGIGAIVRSQVPAIIGLLPEPAQPPATGSRPASRVFAAGGPFALPRPVLAFGNRRVSGQARWPL
jgi:hypothetical protein